MTFNETVFDVAQLAHVELLTPKLEESVAFFRDMLGMCEVERKGDSVYMRAYEDIYHNSLKLTAHHEAGLGQLALRSTSPQALERRVEAIEKAGYGVGWSEGDVGFGRTYQFKSPDGHNLAILWDVEYYEAPEDQKTDLLNRPQKRPNHGVPVRRLDHINILANKADETVEFLETVLGFKLREHIVTPEDSTIGAWMSVTNLVHDIAVMADGLGESGRLHHLCYWYGSPQHLTDVSDLLIDNGHSIEVSPIKHGVSQAMCMYVMEPGGNRIELFGDTGYLIFDPDWKTVKWKGEDAEKAILWHGTSLPEEFFTYGTPIRQKETVESK